MPLNLMLKKSQAYSKSLKELSIDYFVDGLMQDPSICIDGKLPFVNFSKIIRYFTLNYV